VKIIAAARHRVRAATLSMRGRECRNLSGRRLTIVNPSAPGETNLSARFLSTNPVATQKLH